MWRTRVCDLLGIQYPILEGGMSIPGNGELAAAVSNAGGLGVVGFNPGWTPPDKQLENLRNHIRITKSLTGKPFGVNIPLFGDRMGDRQQSMDMMVAERVPVVTTSGGSPALFTKFLKDAGIKVLHIAQNIRQAVKAQEAGVDAIIASGFDAGGLLGPDEIPTLVLVPLIVSAVKLPVVAAGGIGDARGFVAVMALGAEGVQLGTRFMATKECHAHDNFKQAMIKAGDCDTVVTRRNCPPRLRVLKTDFTLASAQLDKSGASEQKIRELIGPGKVREALMLGDLAHGEPACGGVTAMIREVSTCSEIIESLINGTRDVLTRCQQLRDR